MKQIIYYAQNREDLILNFLLKGKKRGFYVDVGANSPVDDSVTKFFYDKNWRGINIEPNQYFLEQFNKQRPRDINLGIASGAKKQALVFRQYFGIHHGLSTMSDEMMRQYKRSGMNYRDIQVTTAPLSEVFEKYVKNRRIDFLKIDVEGLEYDVIKGNDWKKYRPKIVVAEANHIGQDWRPLLVKQKYTKVFFDGLNEYYASQEYLPSVNFELYPVFVTETPGLIHWRDYQKQQSMKEHNTSLRTQLRNARNIINWHYQKPYRFLVSRSYRKFIKRELEDNGGS